MLRLWLWLLTLFIVLVSMTRLLLYLGQWQRSDSDRVSVFPELEMKHIRLGSYIPLTNHARKVTHIAHAQHTHLYMCAAHADH